MAMSVLTVVSTLGIPALFSSIVLLWVNRYFSKKDKDAESVKRGQERLDRLENDISSLRTDLSNHTEKIQNVLNEYNEFLKESKKDRQILSLGVQALLRDRIVNMYNSYAKDKGFLPISTRDSLKNMYEQYHSLGGNGVVTEIYNRLNELPIDPPNDYEGKFAV